MLWVRATSACSASALQTNLVKEFSYFHPFVAASVFPPCNPGLTDATLD